MTGGWVTLAQLAPDLGVTPDALRQRIARGTLAATKAGNTWTVDAGEAQRAREASRYWTMRQKAEALVRKRTGKRQPSGIDQHGGRS